MIMGECPYCDGHISTPIGPPGAFSRETCPTCEKQYWLKHSRLDPVAYTLDSIVADETTGKILEIKE